MAQQRLAFRSAVLPSLGIALAALLIGAVAGVGGMLIRTGFAVDWPAAGVRLLGLAVFIFAVVLAAVLLFRVYVSEEGLRCCTFWGNYRTLRWPEIDSVRPINLLGLIICWLLTLAAAAAGIQGRHRKSIGDIHRISPSTYS